MRTTFVPSAWDDCQHSQGTDPRIVRRIHELIKDTSRNPFTGIGKPVPLRHKYAGYWSRRITEEHRMAYKMEAGDLVIFQLRYHY